jgi:ABC-type uncharacterized transport system permease subunit
MINLFAEGVYVDMWTVSHFLSGALLFVLLVSKRLSICHSILVTVIVAIFWEFLEIRVRVDEVFSNRVVDVVVTVIGFYLIYFVNKKTNFMNSQIKFTLDDGIVYSKNVFFVLYDLDIGINNGIFSSDHLKTGDAAPQIMFAKMSASTASC